MKMTETINQLNSTAGTIWILDPDEDARSAYRSCLSGNYDIQELGLLSTLVSRLQNDEKPDILIAETTMEDGNIMEYLNHFASAIPIIVSTSEDSRSLMERAFESGCKDVLVKPINRNELLIKVKRAMLADGVSGGNAEDDIICDHGRMRVTVAGVSEQLTPKEMQIVMLLKNHPQSRSDIMTYIWEETNVSRKAFDVHLFHLRRKLARLGVSITLNKSGSYFISKDPKA